ncbi:MAG: hypothetical protein R2705_08445 [Ilumatobacteraceae bacterium]
MLVRELIDILNDQPPDSEVELAIIAPIEEEADDITVDRYSVEGILPWDEHAGAPAEDGTEEMVIWLVGGEESDVDAFLDAIEPEDGFEE